MKITNKETIEIINALSSDSIQNKILPRKLSFAIGKNLERLRSQIYKPYLEELKKLENQYQKIDEDGKPVRENGRTVYTDREAYGKELQELLDIENDFDMHTISEDVLDQCENEEKYSELNVKETIVLMRMLEE